LCGDDKYTGKNFDHRREWLVEQIKFLSGIFTIEIAAAYAIMSKVTCNRRVVSLFFTNMCLSFFLFSEKSHQKQPLSD
jgi:hypothetical protein